MSRRFSCLGRMAPVALLVLSTLACASAPKPSPIAGAYRFDDGRRMAVSQSDTDATFRYRDLQSGATGRLYPSGGSGGSGGLAYHSGTGWATEKPVTLNVQFQQDGGRITGLDWKPQGETASPATRVPLREEEIRFRNGEVDLYGKLVLPAEGEGPFPLVVLVHGSGSDAATFTYHRQYQFPLDGVATFVYDKRGTGRSGGKFTMLFDVLAGDALAAASRLRSHPKIDPERIGLAGYSQGGWIAPLAAARDPRIKFVLVGYGMLESPAREEYLETLNAVRARGFGDAEVRKATEIVDAVDRIIRSDLNEGWKELDALERRYRDEPWFDVLRTYTAGRVMRYPHWLMKIYGRKKLSQISWYYDSFATLEKLEIPMLWVLGGKDTSAPNEITIAELERLRAAGKPIDLKIYPTADHGIVEFEEKDGERVYTHYSPGYFELENAWVREKAEG
jgi:pimeloyl-ACP methyl ester carboxylesterase